MLDNYFREYGLIAIFMVVAIIVPASMLMMSLMAGRIGLRPNKPTEIKSDTYECGVEPIGGRWELFNFRYYMFAILFVIFDVEMGEARIYDGYAYMAWCHHRGGYAGYFGSENFGGANFLEACGQFTATELHQAWVDLVAYKAIYFQNTPAQVVSVTLNAVFEQAQ